MTNTPCNIEDCIEPVHSRGLCRRHYGFHHRKGTLESVATPTKAAHKLIRKNTETATGICSICGETEIKYRKHRDYWMCSTPYSLYSARSHKHSYLFDSDGDNRADEVIASRKYFFESQGGRCAICKQPSEKSLHLDHCHETQRLRGLLCRDCNLGLGFFKDDPKRLQEAIDYLRQ